MRSKSTPPSWTTSTNQRRFSLTLKKLSPWSVIGFFVQSFCILLVDQELLIRCIFWCWLGRRRCRLPCSTPWGPCRPTSTTGARLPWSPWSRLPWSPWSRLPCLGRLCVSRQGRRPYLYGREGPIKHQGFPMFGLRMRWNDLLCPRLRQYKVPLSSLCDWHSIFHQIPISVLVGTTITCFSSMWYFLKNRKYIQNIYMGQWKNLL